MELACALVLLIVGSVTAGPYGYGTKGGAAAKADARAVAGAYTGAGSIPLSIPSGASYSGSFSQASSSSSSSSSASSNSFSYSGSGAIGEVHPNGKGCDSGNCNAGGAIGTQGSAAAGSQAYSGAHAGSLAGGYGGKIAAGSYTHKNGNDKGQDCGSENCQGTSDLNSPNAGIGSQSNSDAKVAASAGGGYTVGSNCGGSDCNNAPGADNKCVSGECDLKAKCSSGDCGTASHVGGTPSHYDDSNKCSSGQCGLNQNTDGSSSIDSETNDINVHKSGYANTKSTYGANNPGCSSGNCGSSPGSPAASGYNKPALDLIAPKLGPLCSGSNCQISTSGYISSSQTKAPYFSTSYQNENQLGHVTSPGYGSLSKPTYAHGSSSLYSPAKTSGDASCAPGTPGCASSAPGYGSSSSGKPSYSHPACAPGTPGCIPSPSPSVPSDCASGFCGTHLSIPTVVGTKPSYAYGSSPSFSSVNPLGSACAPGTPGCSTPLSTSRPSDCASGNCGAYPSGYASSSGVKPSPSFSSVNPASPPCNPGSPGCDTSTSPIGPAGCASGSCGGAYPTSTSYSDFSNKPTYSQGSLPSYSSGNSASPACTPGSPGCATLTSPIGPSGCASGNCGGSPTLTGYSDFNNKPSYSHSGSQSYFPSKPSGPGCTPGTPGCGLAPSATGCASGKCSGNPTGLGYDSSSYIKPSYSHGNSPSYTPVKPVELPCSPGTPGCSAVPPSSGPSDCISGNCGLYPSAPGFAGSSSIKPNYSQDLPSFSTLVPSDPACAPGSPGCALSPVASGPSGCASGNCGTYPTSAGGSSTGIKPSYSYGSISGHAQVKPSGPACVPGTPGCALPSAPSGPSSCASGNCDEFPPIGGQGGFPSIKPSYSQGSSSYYPVKASGPVCTPGAPGCAITSSLISPSGCVSGNCGSNPSPPGCAPGTPGCFGSGIYSGASGFPSGHPTAGASFPISGAPSFGISSLPSGQASTGISAPSYGASGVGSSSNQAAYGPHGTASLQTSFIKPSTGIPAGISGSGAYTPGIGYSPQMGAATGASGQHKENLPAYTGGFGGPAGILKPNEYSAALSSSYGNKPTVSTGPTAVKPSCVSGICDAHASPSLGISGSGAYTPGIESSQLGIVGATAGASGQHGAIENLPAYTSGFGGPTGILKPNENSAASSSSYGNKPTVSTGPTAVKPSCVSGICDAHASPELGISGSGAYMPGIGSSQLGIVGATAGASGQHGAKENLPAYTGGFGGPTGILKPNENSAASSSSYGNKPTVSTGPTAVKPSCVSGICDAHASPELGISGSGAYMPGIGSSQLGIVGATAGASGQHGAKENLPAYTGGFGGPTGILKPNENSAASSSSYGNKPTVSTGPTAVKASCVSGICDAHASPSLGISGSGAYTPGIVSSQLGIVGATAGASGQHGAKENLPAYTGGFGGPTGILKPNENSAASSSSYGNKPTVSTGPTTVKPSCVSGICDAHGSPSHDHSGTVSGAHATAAASASANAVAYTGGFGGPPGLLKPYDNGKADIKSATGLATSLDFNQGSGGSGYLSGGSQVDGSAIAQANAAAVSTAGASSGDNKPHSGNNGGYSHGYGHEGAGGCGGGCGGSGSGTLGYSGSLGLSKTGVLDDSSIGLAAAGAVAKSVANASSGARAFGGSYASSSATAHAGASVKGGYGRR